jgi:hypothetical protein
VLEHHDEAAADATDAHELPTNDSAFSKPRRLARIAWAGALAQHPLRSTRLDAPNTAGSDAASAQPGSRGSVSVLIGLVGVWIALVLRW